MDLNELPTEEREDSRYETADNSSYEAAVDSRYETAVETMRREREERRLRMLQKRKADALLQPPPPTFNSNNRQVDRVKSYKVSLPRLPEGWIECPKNGQPLYNLIPSKVPLGDHFNEVVEAGKRYSPKNAAQQLRARGREVGMVIDLTNTTRYYQPSEWRDGGIKYLKIPCRGRNEVPDNASVNIFVFEVMHFMNVQRGNTTHKHVLVHCTHGFNRTGYMIVHYLKRCHPGMTVEQALAEFAAARPPGIYKSHYIDSLFTFFHERRSELLVAPSTPEWKRVDLNGEANGEDEDGDSDGGILAALENINGETAMTNDDILGDPIPDMQQLDMQRACYIGLQINPVRQPPGSNYLYFPGSQPVSLSSANLQLLRQRYYYATWKADGTRYMMFITRDGCYLIDRKFNFRRVQMRFPSKNGDIHHLTLLDGEMVIDEDPETHVRVRRYLIYDIMMLNQEPLAQLPFHERWKRIQTDVVQLRSYDRQTNSWYNYEAEPFTVRRKDFWLLSTTEKLLHGFIKKLSHEADGLIFQGWDDPYLARTNESLLKWKYAHMNSVDFKFQVSDDGSAHQLFLIDKNKLWPLEGSAVVFPGGEDPATLSGKIIECCWLPEEKKWEFMRVRTDKDTPNAVRTYRKVMESIEDNITEEVLLSEIQEILHLPMYRERIQREQRMHRERMLQEQRRASMRRD